ncbi:cutinase family protein [Nocardia suismassiliense]|uniref:cutinase family protein n=1 Tax=Nocardia suismassiliense TaxID=2077092 RepID=UPI00131ED470|nr:cutinase family protein [Nocardia suismassiliense]
MHSTHDDPATASTSVRLTATAVALLALSAIGTNVVSAAPDTGVPIGPTCPALYVWGIQGGEESSPGASTTSDTGALGQMFGPLAARAGELVQRAYIPFGHDSNGTALPYEDAVTAAAQRLEDSAAELVRYCPATKLAVAGYSQGAPAVARFAQRVGSGAATVAPDQVAGIALLANPTRSAHTPVLPGRPQSSTPAAVPGASGQKTATVSLNNPSLSGAGITAAPQVSYGALTGRVADLCVAGDATCDAPTGGPLATTVANIAARSDLRDPIAAISTVADALSATVYTTAVEVINEDLHGTSLDQLSYQPAEPLGQRLAEASQPSTTPPGPNEALAALFKLGSIGLNAVISVAQKVITPQTIAELAVVGMANPWAAVAALGTKVAGAVVELVPPQTASRWVNEAFDAITGTVTDQRELYTLASTAQYSSTTGRHGSYQTVPATATGSSALAATAEWFTAVAQDLGRTTPTRTATHTPTSATTTPAPTSGGR